MLLVLFAAAVRSEEPAPRKGVPLKLPDPPGATADAEDLDDLRMTIAVDAKGGLFIEGIEGPTAEHELWRDPRAPLFSTRRPRTLDDLGVILRTAKDVYDFRTRGSGFEKTATGMKFSRMRVLLRVDRRAPWLHVQWVLTVLAEERIPKIEFAAVAPEGEDRVTTGSPRVVRSWLPVLEPIAESRVIPPTPRTVHVRIRDGRYLLGKRETKDASVLGEWIQKAVRDARADEAEVRSVLHAEPATPAGAVIRVIGLFRAAGHRGPMEFDWAIPGEEVRKRERLPEPSDPVSR